MVTYPAAEDLAGTVGPLRCRDGLLWIGGTYRWFFCGSEKSCAIPYRPVDADHCFVHEAERRGISRKVAAAPKWVIPGLTRVFVAYRGDQKRGDRGRIFGYFVLGRVETLRVSQPMPVPFVETKARGLASRENGLCRVEVVDSESGSRVPSASLAFERVGTPEAVACLSDADSQGCCSIELGAGEYRVRCEAEGYRPGILDRLKVEPGRARVRDFNIEPEDQRPHEKPEPSQKTKECADGSTIVTHEWVDGRWRGTGERCPDDPSEPDECTDRDIRLGFCPDGTIYLAEVCVDGKWRDTGGDCPTNPSVGDEVLAEHRSCSLRLRPGSTYLVDSLAAEIHDAFAVALDSETLRDDYRGAFGDTAREDVAAEGRKLFNTTVDQVLATRKARTTEYAIPPEIQGMVTVRGDLVLFHNPPVFERRPRVSSRSLLRIDGGDLIRGIAAGSEPVGIPVCAEPGTGSSITKDEIVARLSYRANVNNATARLFLDALSELAAEQLSQGVDRSFRLPGLGTFSWRCRKGHPPALEFRLLKPMAELKPSQPRDERNGG